MGYARMCYVTGKGMNEGWVWLDGEFYTSTQEVTIAELRKDILDAQKDGDGVLYADWEINPTELLSMTDDDLLNWAYDVEILFWTEWED
jgi:hypothetical protein